MQHDSTNTIFILATDLVNYTSRHIFLTGKAGTGKTTFLKYIKEQAKKNTVIVAPTGVAAINAGGVTIHSFFQLPLSPFIPETRGFNLNGEEANNKHTLLGRLRLNTERRKILQELELLIIDEISMVRADVLDAIDLVLRHIRGRHLEPFGGVQVLFIGDMFQLPPVVKEHEWSILRDYYQSPYFFDSQVLMEEPPVYIEFTKIYRQSEDVFIGLLNKVRLNQMDDESLEILHKRYQPKFFGEKTEGYILLTTHNEKARDINAEELARIPGKLFTYKAGIDGDFPANAFPADEALQLKIGAQVMFIKNDVSGSRRFFNGKIGVIKQLAADKILVECKDEPEPIEVSKEKWDNIRYSLDKVTRSVSEDVLGSFSQYPLRLAWAITIHKSQGLTFEKAIIDAGKAFAPGQVYVALSRCTSLTGLVLHSRIQSHALFTDSRIVQFNKKLRPLPELSAELVQAKKEYAEKVLLTLFDLTKAITSFKELHSYLVQHQTAFNSEVFTWADALLAKMQSLQATAEKFQAQIKSLFVKLERENGLQDRLKKGAQWFTVEIKIVLEVMQQSPATTDSTMHAKEYNETLREAFVHLSQQHFLMQSFGDGFTIDKYQQSRKLFITPAFGVNAYAGAGEKKVDLKHPSLFYSLKKLRDTLCFKKSVPIYLVAGSKTLDEMATYLPQTIQELEQISGFGKAKVESYGRQFLEIIKAYAGDRNLSSNMVEKGAVRKRKDKGNKEQKTGTKAETFRLYQEGKTVSEIANERKLTVQTIEGHLSYYVLTGAIKIESLVSWEKVVLIEPVLKEFKRGNSLLSIKEKLPGTVSFGEIRLVMAYVDSQKSAPHVNH
ncbi:MAG: helix-turn-helix domain-containing protein [Bacteroidota bacterium]|nr:helix-turn-helix domain-containing protein [Bacteroidota bacterium]